MLYGPEVQLHYRCGDREIIVTSQQDHCGLEAGSVHGRINKTDEALAVSYTQEQGSWYNQTAGNIRWLVEPATTSAVISE